jgi:uncharacterized membrane protein YhaH (DUF805 family)
MGRWFLNFSFNGRARRSHYWANYGAWLAVLLVLLLALGASGKGSAAMPVIGLLLVAAILCGTIDNLALAFRRAHDTGRSGWIWLLLLIPLVQLLPFYWLLIEDSQAGPNKYGPPVKTFYEPPATAAA